MGSPGVKVALRTRLASIPPWGWVLLMATVALPVVLSGYWFPRTGFGEDVWYKSDYLEYRRAKTLWDWMGLLIVPVALALAALWFNHQAVNRAHEAEERRRKEGRKHETDRVREESLQRYLDRMAGFLLDKDLRNSKADSAVRAVAETQTLMVLRRLDGKRKGFLLGFLRESGLIRKGQAIIKLWQADLRRAVLRNAFLSHADLRGADLRGADLRGADLRGAVLIARAGLHQAADLTGADLRGAVLFEMRLKGMALTKVNLTGTDLFRADLSEADLSGADLSEARGLTQDQLDSAKGNAGTRLPEGLNRPESWNGPAERRPDEMTPAEGAADASSGRHDAS